MSLSHSARRRSRRIATVVVAGLALGLAVAANPADALTKPTGSRGIVMVETGNTTGNPSAALTSGWWGHEGGANNGTGNGDTELSLDLSNDGNPPAVNDTTIAAALAALGASSTDQIGYAIVPFSADGSNEDPTVTSGEDAATAFANQTTGTKGAILYPGFGGSLNGNTNPNDSVAVVSTYTQVHNWVLAGRPVQSFDNSLVLHDATAPGTPVSTAPQGSSILNNWPAGTQLSLVAYVTDGTNAALDNQVPNVKVGGDGHALTAWVPLTTVAKPGDALRSSAGYQFAGAYKPTVSVSTSYTATGTTLTATVKNKNGLVATDATGNVEFAQVVGGGDQPPTTVAATNGVATLSLTAAQLPAGTPRTYDVRYVPDVAGQANYLTSDYTRVTVLPPYATTTSLTVTGGATDTLTARVSPAAAGHVTFKNGSTTLGTVTVSGGVAKLVKPLSAGKHVLTATFTPNTGTPYKSSIGSKTIWQPTISARMSATRIVHGTHPRVLVKVIATGATVSGRIQVVYDPPVGATRTFTVTLRAGAGTVTLPAVPKGLTRITVKYLGNTQILAANKALSFRAV